MNYDPNLFNSGRRANQTVRLTFAVWEYRLTTEVVVGGNCKGLSILGYAVSNFYDALYKASEETEFPGEVSITLKNSNGDELICDEEFEREEEWLADMLISAEIVTVKSARRA